jgi:hypothetical protein
MELDQLKHKAQARLIAVSAAILFLLYADARIQGISLGIASVEFRNGRAIVEFFWIFWLYYYIRAYQYFKDSGQAEYRASLDHVVLQAFGPRILRMTPEDFELLPAQDPLKSSLVRARLLFFPREYLQLSEVSESVRSEKTPPRPRAGGRVRINFLRPRTHTLRLARIRLAWRSYALGVRIAIYPQTSKYDPQGRGKQFLYFGGGSIPQLAMCTIRSVVMRAGFAETYGPLIIGLLPVWYVILV